MKYNFDERIERRGTHCVKWDEASSDVIPLWVADMDFAVAPAIQQAVKRRAEHPVFAYTVVEDDYYDAIVSWFHRRHQWDISRKHIIYTTGVVPAVSCALKALTMPGEKVLTLSPAYNCFFSSIRNNGCEVLECPLQLVSDSHKQDSNKSEEGITARRFEVDWQLFEQQCADEKTTVFLLCNPHNPTGRVWTREELQQMSDICRRHGVRIVSDEIHCEIVMPGYTFVPMGTIDADAVILNSPSKSFNTAGLQTANIICRDAETRRRIDRAVNINEVCDIGPFGPAALIAAYNDSEDWLDEMCQYVSGNYLALCDFASSHLPSWDVMPMEGTYLAWVRVTTDDGENVADYCDRLLRDSRVWLNPGTLYSPDNGEGYIRINLACPRSLLIEALERIAGK